jgi:hypothetical protein
MTETVGLRTPAPEVAATRISKTELPCAEELPDQVLSDQVERPVALKQLLVDPLASTCTSRIDSSKQLPELATLHIVMM